jgi:hypothetical protein
MDFTSLDDAIRNFLIQHQIEKHDRYNLNGDTTNLEDPQLQSIVQAFRMMAERGSGLYPINQTPESDVQKHLSKLEEVKHFNEQEKLMELNAILEGVRQAYSKLPDVQVILVP